MYDGGAPSRKGPHARKVRSFRDFFDDLAGALRHRRAARRPPARRSPTSLPSSSTTGSRRTWCCAISRSASSSPVCGSIVTRFCEATSSTFVARAGRVGASATRSRIAMSPRSVERRLVAASRRRRSADSARVPRRRAPRSASSRASTTPAALEGRRMLFRELERIARSLTDSSRMFVLTEPATAISRTDATDRSAATASTR